LPLEEVRSKKLGLCPIAARESLKNSRKVPLNMIFGFKQGFEKPDVLYVCNPCTWRPAWAT
jgi:hypothetical protein